MNDKKMVIGTGTNEIHLEFATIQEKREWLQAIDKCKRTLHYADMPQFHEDYDRRVGVSEAQEDGKEEDDVVADLDQGRNDVNKLLQP